MTVVFDYGEVRHVKLRIHSCKNENFEIVSASYTLTVAGETEPEDSGLCIILGHTLDMVINPKKKVRYLLKITYYIGDETLIDTVEVRVI